MTPTINLIKPRWYAYFLQRWCHLEPYVHAGTSLASRRGNWSRELGRKLMMDSPKKVSA